MTDNGPPFRSQEFKEYAAQSGFSVRNITPAEPKVNGQAERFMKNITKTVQTAIANKGDWKEELMIFLRNYRATPHQTTGKAPAELMFPNRNFKTKVPTLKPTTPYHQDKEVREHDRLKKEAMKRYADSKRYVKEHKVKTGDAVLVPQKKKNKFTTPYRNMKYVVIKVKGSMITARNELGHIITRDASKMKKVQERELDTDDEEPPRPNDLLRESENEVKEVCQPRCEQDDVSKSLRRSTRIRKATINTKYRDYIT